MDILKERWNYIIDILINNKSKLTKIEVYNLLIEWCQNLLLYKNKKYKELYTKYFLYFNEIEISEYEFEEYWFDLQDLLDNELLKLKFSNSDELFYDKLNKILLKLIVFETDLECPNHDYGHISIFTNKLRNKYYYCCEVCGDINPPINKAEKIELFLPINKYEAKFLKLNVNSH